MREGATAVAVHAVDADPPISADSYEVHRDRGGVGEEVAAKPMFAMRTGVAVFPPVPRAQLLSWMAEADVVVNTSEAEGQSNAILEAMAVGTPVVARGCAGNACLVRDGETGLLVNDAEGMVRACAAVARREGGDGEAALRTAIVGAARAYVARAHSSEGEAEAWRGLVVGLLK